MVAVVYLGFEQWGIQEVWGIEFPQRGSGVKPWSGVSQNLNPLSKLIHKYCCSRKRKCARCKHFYQSSLRSKANAIIWCYLLCTEYCIRIPYKNCQHQGGHGRLQLETNIIKIKRLLYLLSASHTMMVSQSTSSSRSQLGPSRRSTMAP